MAVSSCSSAVVVVGIPEGRWVTHNEDAKWLTVFPAEIWQAIVNWVTDPAVMYNMAKASPFLARFLESQRSIYLLHEVLKVRDVGHQSTGLQGRTPNLCDYLGTKELLKCRLVCSGWKQAVNRFLESRPHHFTVSIAAAGLQTRYRNALAVKIPAPLDRQEDPSYPVHFRLQYFTVGVRDNEERLLAHIRSSYYSDNPTDHCPTPTRHLEIIENVRHRQPQPAIENRKFRQGKMAMQSGGPPPPPVAPPPHRDNNRRFVKSFLEQVGRSFHHLTIQTDSYKTIQEYVELMPNLKSLYITARTDWGQVEMEDIGIAFPTLKNINLVSLNGLPDPASKLIFDANPGAQIVEIFSYHPDLQGQKKTGNCLVPWPQNPVRIATTIKFTDELIGMPMVWKLDILKLNFSWERFIDWGTIFRKLECYQDTLTELYLELPLPPNDAPVGWVLANTWEASRSQLNLPNLKRLEVKAGKICSLDFLLGLQSLEYLCLWLYYNVNEETKLVGGIQEETINFNRGFSERFMECNIWALMGNLKQVDLKTGILPMRKFKRNVD